MSSQLYENTRYAGTWEQPWGEAQSLEVERSFHYAPNCSRLVLRLDIERLWNAALREHDGILRVATVRTMPRGLCFEIHCRRSSDPPVRFVYRWEQDSVHGLSLRAERPWDMDRTSRRRLDDEWAQVLAIVAEKCPQLLVRGERLHWLPTIPIGRLREIWKRKGKPETGKLVLADVLSVSDGSMTLVFSASTSTITPRVQPTLLTEPRDAQRRNQEDSATQAALARIPASLAHFDRLQSPDRREPPAPQSQTGDVGSAERARQTRREREYSEPQAGRHAPASPREREQRRSSQRPEPSSDNVSDATRFEADGKRRPTKSGERASQVAFDAAAGRLASRGHPSPIEPVATETSGLAETSNDILLVRLRHIREQIREMDDSDLSSTEIDELLRQYPERSEVYLLAFEIFRRMTNLRRARNTLDALESLDGHDETTLYEIARARKELATLFEAIGPGPEDSLEAWIAYAKLRPLDEHAFARVLQLCGDLGHHRELEAILRSRIAAVVDQEHPGQTAVSADEIPFEGYQYPVAALYPAAVLLALTTRDNSELRARNLRAFRDANALPEEWWEDARRSIDALAPIPTELDRAEKIVDDLRTMQKSYRHKKPAADQAIEVRPLPREGDEEDILDRPKKLPPWFAGLDTVEVDENGDCVVVDPPDHEELLRRRGLTETEFRSMRANADPVILGIGRLDTIADAGAPEELHRALELADELLKITVTSEHRAAILLRKARLQRRLGIDPKRVSFTLTGVRILRPHSISAHIELIELFLRDGQKNKAREAAIAMLDSLIEAHEEMNYEAAGLPSILRRAGIEHSRMLPSRVRRELQEAHPRLIDRLDES